MPAANPQPQELFRPAGMTEFERGVEAGKISSRLDQHDNHFVRINGSFERLAATYESLDRKVNAIAESQRIEAANRLVVAAALEDEKDKRDEREGKTWTTRERWLAVGGFAFACVNLVGSYT